MHMWWAHGSKLCSYVHHSTVCHMLFLFGSSDCGCLPRWSVPYDSGTCPALLHSRLVMDPAGILGHPMCRCGLLDVGSNFAAAVTTVEGTNQCLMLKERLPDNNGVVLEQLHACDAFHLLGLSLKATDTITGSW